MLEFDERQGRLSKHMHETHLSILSAYAHALESSPAIVPRRFSILSALLIMGNKDCPGLGRRRPCTLHSKKLGAPKAVSKPCKECGEWACKTHCHCGRMGLASGRGGPRLYGKAKASVAPKAVAAPAVSVTSSSAVSPVGRPSNESCRRLHGEEWWSRVVEDLRDARDVELASYCMDEDALFRVLERGLSRNLNLNLYIDREQFAGGVPRKQRAAIRRLYDKGAKVYICKGLRRNGSFHSKALLINRRVLCMGGANFTNKSHDNRETMFRATGQVVSEVLADAADWRRDAVPWDGL